MEKIVFSVALALLGAFIGGSSAWSQNQAEGRKLYTAYCTSCHGDKGKGDGVAAGSLPVRPKDHTDGATMNQLTDQFLGDVITKGGGAMGKSGFMPAWGSSLNEKQVRDIVAYIRTLAVPPNK
jgi:mono/diheme cytochrome c family protein